MGTTERQYHTITVSPVGTAVGAEIGGVDLAAGVDEAQMTELRQAFADHEVIFLRDQDITPEQHLAFAERWGAVNVNRFFTAVPDHPRIAEVRKEPDQTTNIGGGWHTDHSYDQLPAMGSLLYAREVPPVGGDTMFASMSAAYAALSEGLQDTLRGLRAEHSSRHVFGRREYGESTNNRIGNPEAATQDALHPVVIEHPLSGRPCLYVNGAFTLRFQGWSDEESQPLLRYLYRHAARAEFTYRFQWRVGSMAIWDNRAVQHYALNDYQGERRLMHRVTIEGEKLESAA
jgi:taurine dioxygenase